MRLIATCLLSLFLALSVACAGGDKNDAAAKSTDDSSSTATPDADAETDEEVPVSDAPPEGDSEPRGEEEEGAARSPFGGEQVETESNVPDDSEG